MKTGNFRKSFLLSVLIAITTTMGCSGTKDIYEVGTLAVNSVSDMILPDEKPLLKKKVLVTPVIDKAKISSSLSEEINKEFISCLSENEYFSVSSLDKWDDEEPDSLLEQYGAIINPAHLKSADKMGMNLVLAIIIHPIEVTEIRRGVWPFRKDVHNVQVSVSINALDTMNGTLIVNKSITKNVKGGEVNPAEDKNWKPGDDFLKKEITSFVKKLSSKVIEDLNSKPWKSKLYSDGDKFFLKAGRDAGITEGTVFEIYTKGEPIAAYSGEKYYVFGDKIGETRVKSLSRNEAVIAVSADGKYKDAAFVSVKKDD